MDWVLSRLKLESSNNGAAGSEATVRLRAPETFTREYARVKDSFEVQSQADIHSLGVLFWELPQRGLKPFHDKSESQVVHLLTAGGTEQIDAKWPILYQLLIKDCWNCNPALRPSAEEITQRLKAMKNGHFHLFALQELGLIKELTNIIVWNIHNPLVAQLKKEIAYLDKVARRSDAQNERLDYLLNYLNIKRENLQNN